MNNIVVTETPKVETADEIKLDLGLKDEQLPVTVGQAKPELVAQADEIVERFMSVSAQDLEVREQYRHSIARIGEPIQKELAQQSKMLKAPMTTLVKDAEDGGLVGNSLLNLQGQVNSINPNRVDFTMGTLRRIMSKIPGVGTPLSNWFAKYQAVDAVINDIVKSLESGKGQLERDNSTLNDDQIRMRKLTFKLQDYIELAKLLDIKLEEAISSLSADDEKRKFIEEELIFPLKQRILDLQQQLAVNQQGILATEVIIRNNRQLIIGVSRSLNVTITALNTAATLQVALQHQKRVLEGVQAITSTTDDLIVQTAQQLKTQGVKIQQQAADATLDIEKLKQAFNDVDAAMKEISQFRRDAIPQMAKSITEMDSVTSKMESSISKMEKGNKVSDEFVLEIV